MKLLLDEQLPRTLTRHFPNDFTVDHVQRLGCETTKNGELSEPMFVRVDANPDGTVDT